MKSDPSIPHSFDSISALHEVLGFPKPLHPLISLVNYADIVTPFDELPTTLLLNFYKISYKKSLTGKVRYGQGYYDFDEGHLSFVSPHQLISGGEEGNDYAGYTLLFHRDLLRNYSLDAKIKNYGFFTYASNEALFLSDKEKQVIFRVFENIKEELNNPIDDTTQEVLVAHLEVLLNYSNRFYKRQFITRQVVNSEVLTRLEQLLHDYFNTDEPLQNGIPTVEYLAQQLNVSPRYLSDMLRLLTGQNAQQHIHHALIEKAKEYLANTQLSVGEIAYQLGFQQPQSFNKLFKKKTHLTPIAFKESFK
ncbi:helix-turn-helix domain-containing protein [Paraflavitalea pollutisoli]|uniref:helix-turn-helix domain-containing protein n=1 Tax=Paraflavitalea pollutisoli TaxID=3034143 RepID=UPI0023EC5913|nr:AraC family transcriptional regulator [Paraflavitalea sp. H1-2-19X]